MLRWQRELNIPFHSVESKMSGVGKNLTDTLVEDSGRNRMIFVNVDFND